MSANPPLPYATVSRSFGSQKDDESTDRALLTKSTNVPKQEMPDRKGDEGEDKENLYGRKPLAQEPYENGKESIAEHESMSEKQQLAFLMRTVHNLMDQSQVQSTQIDSLTGQNVHLTNQNMSMNGQLQIQAGQIDSLTGQNVHLTNQNMSMNGQLQIQAGQIDSLTGQNVHLTNQNMSMNGQLQIQAGQINSLMGQNQVQAAQIESLTGQNMHLTNLSAEKDTTIKILQEKTEMQDARIENLENVNEGMLILMDGGQCRNAMLYFIAKKFFPKKKGESFKDYFERIHEADPNFFDSIESMRKFVAAVEKLSDQRNKAAHPPSADVTTVARFLANMRWKEKNCPECEGVDLFQPFRKLLLEKLCLRMDTKLVEEEKNQRKEDERKL